MKNFSKILQQEWPGEVAYDKQTLATASRDASIFSITPQVVAYPKNAQELGSLVHFAKKYAKNPPAGGEVSLTARSAGTDMSGGPLNDSIIVDFSKHFTHIDKIKGTSVSTQPGVFYRDFEHHTLRHSLLMPSYPASRELCTIGGMVANNSGGEKSLSYGKTEDYVTSLRVVLHDGKEYEFKVLSKKELEKKLEQKGVEGKLYHEIFTLLEKNKALLQKTKPHVSKNSAGYNIWDVWNGNTFDITKLFVGSQGTLGLITQATFNLIAPKRFSRLLVIFLNDFSIIADLVSSVLSHKPESFESYDDHTLKLALRFFPDIIKRMKTGNLLSLAWQFLPEAWMTITGGMPKLILIAEFTGNSLNDVLDQAAKAQQALGSLNLKTHITKSDSETQKYWTIRRESFSLLRQHTKGKSTAPFIDDFIVPPKQLPEFLPELESIMKEYPLTYTIAGHVGDGNFHIIPLMDLSDAQSPVIIKNLARSVYTLVAKYGGSITAEHNDGLIRTPFLHAMYSKEVLEIFKEIKHIFDPHGIFNPKKKVDLTFEEAIKHLKKS